MIFSNAHDPWTRTVQRRGHIPDNPHRLRAYNPAALHPKLLAALAAGIADEGTLERFECTTFDQGRSGSCFGHGSAQSIVQTFAASPEPLDDDFIPSPDDFYRDARAHARPTVNERLTDCGVVPSDGFAVFGTCGVGKMHPLGTNGLTTDGRFSDVECDDAHLNAEPNFTEECNERLLLAPGAYLINPYAPGAGDLICAAIQADLSVGIGILVDTGFERWMEDWTKGMAPLATINRDDPNIGGHWLNLNAFSKKVVPGALTVGGANSWGPIGAPALVDQGGCKNARGHYAIVWDAFVKQQTISSAIVYDVKRLSKKAAA